MGIVMEYHSMGAGQSMHVSPTPPAPAYFRHTYTAITEYAPPRGWQQQAGTRWVDHIVRPRIVAEFFRTCMLAKSRSRTFRRDTAK